MKADDAVAHGDGAYRLCTMLFLSHLFGARPEFHKILIHDAEEVGITAPRTPKTVKNVLDEGRICIFRRLQAVFQQFQDPVRFGFRMILPNIDDFIGPMPLQLRVFDALAQVPDILDEASRMTMGMAHISRSNSTLWVW